MWSPRKGSSRRPRSRRWAAWAALAVGWLLPSAGCQVEYAGMTLPSGKYMHDDVQYFSPGPDFPWANTQAATQRARMQAMGLEPTATGPLVAPVPPGTIPGVQNQLGRPTDVNGPLNVVPPPPAPGGPAPGPVPAPPGPNEGVVPGAIPAPGAGVPAEPTSPP